MKIQINLFIWLLVGFFPLASLGQPASITNFTKSVHYVPPVGFNLEDYFRDSGEKDWPADLFKYFGSGVQYDKTNGDDTILFMLEPACYINPNGGGVFNPLLPRTPADLRDDFSRYFHGETMSMTNFPDAKIGKTAGYTSVSASRQNVTADSQLFYVCWIQIQSNIVVTVTITSYNKKSFDAATNSLRTLKINKKEIMNIVKPRAS
jgi:hypothetical protein